MTWVLRAPTHATAVGWLDDIVRRTVSTACADMANRPTARPADTPQTVFISASLVQSRGRNRDPLAVPTDRESTRLELQSLLRLPSAAFCFNIKHYPINQDHHSQNQYQTHITSPHK